MPKLQTKRTKKTSETSIGFRNNLTLRLVQIILVYLTIYLLFLIPVSNKLLEIKTQTILNSVEKKFDTITKQFSYFITPENLNVSCDDKLADLRKSVFDSDYAKEIGMFDTKGKIYCTSNSGATSFYLYETILERLQNNSENVTLSYTRSKLSQTRSVALVFSNSAGHGLSILIPPRYLLREVDLKLTNEKVNYQVSIIDRNLDDQPLKRGIATYTAESDKYPLNITISSTTSYYLSQFWRHLWVVIVLASLSSTFYILRLQRASNNNSLENSLRYAMEHDYLELHYQPIVDQKTGDTVGCESLLRWKDPVQGFISPEIFIPLAEKVNLIEDITKLVIEKVACLLTEEPPLFAKRYISINISRSVILKSSFVQFIETFIESHPQFPDKIIFEITEDNNFSKEELATLKEHLLRISNYGFKFAVDDFGTGYSGLDFIRQFPFDYVKIDRVFVKSLYDDSTIIPLLDSMMTLATQLNMMTIVEGVEEKSQLEILDRLGFKYIQGYYYSRPLPKTELISFLK